MFYFLSLCDSVAYSLLLAGSNCLHSTFSSHERWLVFRNGCSFVFYEYVETACFESGLTAWFDCNTLV